MGVLGGLEWVILGSFGGYIGRHSFHFPRFRRLDDWENIGFLFL